jgi:hypothetical protein
MSACLRCGAVNEGAQAFCFECGIALPGRSADPWRVPRASSLNPIWTALGVLLLGAVGALAAVAATRRDSGPATLVATNLPAHTVVQTLPVLRTPAVTVPPAPIIVTTTSSRSAVKKPKVTTLTEWTAADGYTIVLASIPAANGLDNAELFAKRALARGLTHVGVLDSQDFSSLHPGYFVVFTGFYRSNGAAAAHISQAEAAGFGPAYARRITR